MNDARKSLLFYHLVEWIILLNANNIMAPEQAMEHNIGIVSITFYKLPMQKLKILFSTSSFESTPKNA